ncbi:MAG TPA: precorrin-8X methylmutase [Acidimicrobiales bacterium]|nr:precorrin-8X methylmutase [Acidimicrobiales bacterium]
MTGIHPIEEQSYAIMAGLVDLSGWPWPDRAVVARMVHATADESFATSARIGREAVVGAVAALRDGATVICDARMVVAGIPAVAAARDVRCYLDAVPGPAPEGRTRSEMAVEVAAAEWPHGALWVVGNAPTALARLIALATAGQLRPAAVIGVPVGYVGAAEAKADLWSSPLAGISITNDGRRGGTPVAAAAVNALWRLAQD